MKAFIFYWNEGLDRSKGWLQAIRYQAAHSSCSARAGIPEEFNEYLPKDTDEYKRWKSHTEASTAGEKLEGRFSYPRALLQLWRNPRHFSVAAMTVTPADEGTAAPANNEVASSAAAAPADGEKKEKARRRSPSSYGSEGLTGAPCPLSNEQKSKKDKNKQEIVVELSARTKRKMTTTIYGLGEATSTCRAAQCRPGSSSRAAAPRRLLRHQGCGRGQGHGQEVCVWRVGRQDRGREGDNRDPGKQGMAGSAPSHGPCSHLVGRARICPGASRHDALLFGFAGPQGDFVLQSPELILKTYGKDHGITDAHFFMKSDEAGKKKVPMFGGAAGADD